MAPRYEINISENVFNPAFYPYLYKIFNYEVFWGGRGSGKSKVIAQRLVLQLSTLEHRNLVAMRKQATDCRNSCFAEIYKVIYEFHLEGVWDIRENPDMRMYNKVTHSEIIFTGMDKVENVKSLTFKHGNATDLWYEELTEEPIEENLITLDTSIRSYGMKCRVIVSFNPPLATFWIFHWMKTALNFDGTPNTRTYTIETLVEGVMVTSDCLIHHSTYKDNKWNFKLNKDGTADYSKPGAYAAKLERLKYSNPYKYRTECLGLPGTAGESVFNANKIAARLEFLQDYHQNNPPTKVNFAYTADDRDMPVISTVHPEESDTGETLIYFMPNPKHPYVAALDTAGEGIDPYVLQVCDNITDEQVAVFRSFDSADHCMIQVYGLLKLYNDALIAPEVNFSDYPIFKLKEWGYQNIYQRESPKDDYHDTMEQKLGFRTTSGNRQSIIDNNIAWSKHNMDKYYDVETLLEMQSFTRQDKKNKNIFMGAEPGAHDDLVIAWSILLKAKEQQVGYEIAEIKVITGYWTKGELEIAVAKGKIDREVADNYMLEHENRFKKEVRRRSKYAR